jgi:protein subunit release factor B
LKTEVGEHLLDEHEEHQVVLKVIFFEVTGEDVYGTQSLKQVFTACNVYHKQRHKVACIHQQAMVLPEAEFDVQIDMNDVRVISFVLQDQEDNR